MQLFSAKLSIEIDESKFRKRWELEQRLNAGPHVEFFFADNRIIKAQIHSSPRSPWEDGNFRKTFELVVHNTNVGGPECKVTWLG